MQIRKEPASEILAVHDFLGTQQHLPARDQCAADCVQSIESVLFLHGATFSTATVSDVRVADSDAHPPLSLRQHPPRALTDKKIQSIWTK